MRQIEPTTNKQLVAPIALINGMFPEDRIPLFKYDTSESVDQRAMIATLAKGADIGMEIDVEWAHQALQIPRAGKDAKILTLSGKSVTPAANAALTRLAALAAKDKTGDIVSAYSQQLAALAATHEEALIQQIGAVVAEAGSFEDAITGIEALNLSGSAWAESLQLGMAAANLAGRGDIGTSK